VHVQQPPVLRLMLIKIGRVGTAPDQARRSVRTTAGVATPKNRLCLCKSDITVKICQGAGIQLRDWYAQTVGLNRQRKQRWTKVDKKESHC